jgi:TetR/AcrR family transcriptional regulator, transcriptional repressor for nem operon
MPPRSREQTKQATRDALIAAGIHELGAHGLDVSQEAICARAKRTRGAFYVHFADRDDFIVAVMQHVLGGFIAMLTSSSADVRTSIRLFSEAVRRRAPVVAGGAKLRFHHILDACRRSRAIGDAYRGVVATAIASLVAAIQRDQKAGRVQRELDPQTVAQQMVVTVLGMLAVTELDLPIEIDRIEQALLAML